MTTIETPQMQAMIRKQMRKAKVDRKVKNKINWIKRIERAFNFSHSKN